MFLTGDATFASLGRRDDPRRRDRGARLADRPAGAALEARRQGRPAARPVRRPAPPRRRRRPDLGRDRRPRPAPARAVRGPRRRLAARARAAGAPAAHGAARGPRRSRSRSPVVQDLRADAAGVPRQGDAGQRRRQGTERQRTRGPQAAIAPARAAGARERPRARADHGRRQQGRHRRERHRPDRREREPTRASNAASRALRKTIVPADRRRRPDTSRPGVTGWTAEWKDGDRRAEVEPAARRRVRARSSRSC